MACHAFHTCQRDLRAHVPTYQRAKSVPTSHFYVPTCQRANKRADVPIFQLGVPTCQMRANFYTIFQKNPKMVHKMFRHLVVKASST